MTFLIDTQILIWYSGGSSRLATSFRDAIENPQSDIAISSASLWEIAVKTSLGKLTMNVSFKNLEDYLSSKRIVTLNFNHQDLTTLIQLPFHHRDPFDRLIISQAITNQLTIITSDTAFKQYPVQLLDTQ